MDKQALQTLVEKLDQKAITLKEGKEWVKATYGIESAARTREAFIKEMGAKVSAAAESAPAPSKRQVLEAAILAFQARIAAAQAAEELGEIINQVLAAEFEESVKGGLLRLIDERIAALEQAKPAEEEAALPADEVIGEDAPAPTNDQWLAMLKQADSQANEAEQALSEGEVLAFISEHAEGEMFNLLEQAVTAYFDRKPVAKPMVRQSSAIKPTKLVWEIADRMLAEAQAAGKPAPSRKEVQDACIAAGVATGTARTQYQAWTAARKNTQANAEAARAASERINRGL